MDQNTLLIIESFSIAAFNVFAVYIAAISYSLPWASVLMVMVLISFITASIVRLLLSKMIKRDLYTTTLSSIRTTVLIALISSFSIFIILSFRFNIPMALGISFLSGFLTALLRHLMK